MNNKKNNGFTLMEVVVVTVVIGILAVISVPMYRGYVEKSKQAEGKALAAAITIAQKMYYTKHNEYLEIAAAVDRSSELGIDARSNTYFQQFRVIIDPPSYGGAEFSIFVIGNAEAPWRIMYLYFNDKAPETTIFDL